VESGTGKKCKGTRLDLSIFEGANVTWLQRKRMEEVENKVLQDVLFLFCTLVLELGGCRGVGELGFVVEVG
jgi:hypothetical protein